MKTAEAHNLQLTGKIELPQMRKLTVREIRKQTLEMYMRQPKKVLAKMLLDANEILDSMEVKELLEDKFQ